VTMATFPANDAVIGSAVLIAPRLVMRILKTPRPKPRRTRRGGSMIGQVIDGVQHEVREDQIWHILPNELEPQPVCSLPDVGETRADFSYVVDGCAGIQDGDAEEAQPQAADP